MKKAIVFTGPDRSGKSRLVDLITEGKETIYYRGNKLHLKNFFMDLTPNIEVIVFDDVALNKFPFEFFYEWISRGFTFYGPDKSQITIYPQIIITANCLRSDWPKGESAQRRFNIFEIAACNKISEKVIQHDHLRRLRNK